MHLMSKTIRLICLFLLYGTLRVVPVLAQEMQPRAYLPAPTGVGFAGIGYSHNSGSLLFDPSLPVEDAHVTAHVANLSFGASFGALGRSSQALIVMPYAVADITGRLEGTEQYRYRSGLADITLRYAMNLVGAPAMTRKEFASYKQGTIVGVSLTASAPTGQYDPGVLLNIGANRWAFKPELGVSTVLGRWTLEGAFGAWLYTSNPSFAGDSVRTQKPLWSTQAHIVRLIGRRHWFALDATYFSGGRIKINGKPSADDLSNTRIGLTYGLAIDRRQALRFSYFEGITYSIGSNLRTFGVAYQVIWR